MPILDITEYSGLATTRDGNKIMAGQEPSLINQQVAIAGASEQSAPFQDTTHFIRIHCDTPCRVAVGSDPTASGASMRIGAGGTEYLGVMPGLKLAVIATT